MLFSIIQYISLIAILFYLFIEHFKLLIDNHSFILIFIFILFKFGLNEDHHFAGSLIRSINFSCIICRGILARLVSALYYNVQLELFWSVEGSNLGIDILFFFQFSILNHYLFRKMFDTNFFPYHCFLSVVCFSF